MVANTVEVVEETNAVTVTPIVTTVVPTSLDVSVQVPDETVTLTIDLLEATVIADQTPVSVTVDNTQLNVLTVGVQGPAGVVEEEVVYAKRVDFLGSGGGGGASDEILYRAEAVPGTAESANLWRIRKIVIAAGDGDVVETWADGNALFNKVWDDRLTYTYS